MEQQVYKWWIVGQDRERLWANDWPLLRFLFGTWRSISSLTNLDHPGTVPIFSFKSVRARACSRDSFISFSRFPTAGTEILSTFNRNARCGLRKSWRWNHKTLDCVPALAVRLVKRWVLSWPGVHRLRALEGATLRLVIKDNKSHLFLRVNRHVLDQVMAS